MLCPIGQSNEKPPLQALAKWWEHVTKAIDNYSEWTIAYTKSMRNPMLGFTTAINAAFTMIIAHRMRTVANADQIVVLKEGRIAEHGSPKELIEKDGIFAAMSRLQTEGQKWTMA